MRVIHEQQSITRQQLQILTQRRHRSIMRKHPIRQHERPCTNAATLQSSLKARHIPMLESQHRTIQELRRILQSRMSALIHQRMRELPAQCLSHDQIGHITRTRQQRRLRPEEFTKLLLQPPVKLVIPRGDARGCHVQTVARQPILHRSNNPGMTREPEIVTAGKVRQRLPLMTDVSAPDLLERVSFAHVPKTLTTHPHWKRGKFDLAPTRA